MRAGCDPRGRQPLWFKSLPVCLCMSVFDWRELWSFTAPCATYTDGQAVLTQCVWTLLLAAVVQAPSVSTQLS
jgi:hypothetical protein